MICRSNKKDMVCREMEGAAGHEHAVHLAAEQELVLYPDFCGKN
jgi:hypothetical protein